MKTRKWLKDHRASQARFPFFYSLSKQLRKSLLGSRYQVWTIVVTLLVQASTNSKLIQTYGNYVGRPRSRSVVFTASGCTTRPNQYSKWLWLAEFVVQGFDAAVRGWIKDPAGLTDRVRSKVLGGVIYAVQKWSTYML